jgi:hypothetical protein
VITDLAFDSKIAGQYRTQLTKEDRQELGARKNRIEMPAKKGGVSVSNFSQKGRGFLSRVW